MTAKQTAILDELLSQLDSEYKTMFADLAEYAVEMGCRPVRCKTADCTIDFEHSKTKMKLMKLECSRDGIPGLRLRFFAAESYTEPFSNGIKAVIEGFGGKYTGCYGCGRCDGTQGYTYTYPDGRSVYRCGRELVPIINFHPSDSTEIKALIKAQIDFYTEYLKK